MNWKEKIQITAFIMLAVIMVGGLVTGAIWSGITNDRLNAERRAALKFQHQEVVELKVGGHGQIIQIHWDRFHEPYLIRVRTDEGLEDHWMDEYEVKQ